MPSRDDSQARRNRRSVLGALSPMLVGVLAMLAAILLDKGVLVLPLMVLSTLLSVVGVLRYQRSHVEVEAVREDAKHADDLPVGRGVSQLRVGSKLVLVHPLWLRAALYAPGAATLGFLLAWSRFVGPVGNLSVLLALAVAGTIVAFFTLHMIKVKIRIGVDGIVTSYVGRERFFPFSDVESVRLEADSRGKAGMIEISGRDGQRLSIPFGPQESRDLVDGTMVEPAEIAERIRLALERNRQSHAAGAALLVRRDRGPIQWVAALRAIGAGGNADMRTAPVDPRDMLRIAEDAGAPAATRAAAAIAALPELGDEAKTRIRVAADGTASNPLRLALQRIASDEPDDAAIAEALDELEPRIAKQRK